MIYQLNNENLNEIVKLTNKAESSFIISYTSALLNESSFAESKFDHQEDHRNAVWYIILSYLFSNSESHFNRKVFIRQTITDLAAHYNLSYQQLIKYLAKTILTIKKGIFKPDLNSIIDELYNETANKDYSEDSINTKLEKIKHCFWRVPDTVDPVL